jgi:signal transduction histidine kinase
MISGTDRRPSRAAQPKGARSAEALLTDAALDFACAVARPLTLSRLGSELASHLPSVIAQDGWALAVADSTSGQIRLACHHGLGDDVPWIEARMQAVWSAAAADTAVVQHVDGNVVDLGARVGASVVATGLFVVRLASSPSDERVQVARDRLPAVCAMLGAALDRIDRVAHLERRWHREASSEAAAGIGQVLRGALFAMSSASQLLRFRAMEDPVIEKNVGRVLREVEHLNRVTASLLEFGRQEPLALASADPDALWDTVLDAHRGQIESRSLALRRARATPPRRRLIDAARISDAFSHLLTYAAAAATEAAELVLESAHLPDGAWQCRLAATGISIPLPVFDRVFELFFSPGIPGTGAGLALARRFIEEHGGTLTLVSTDVLGTALLVNLPASADQ